MAAVAATDPVCAFGLLDTRTNQLVLDVHGAVWMRPDERRTALCREPWEIVVPIRVVRVWGD
jgi:hypothetical protein